MEYILAIWNQKESASSFQNFGDHSSLECSAPHYDNSFER